VAGLMFLNVGPQDVSLMLGRPVDWHPRENRALLYDRHTDKQSLLVPFLSPEADR
jgi:DNA segregation ATPase FtsK/SpoIIIE, S-DNA-T family